MEKHRKAAEAHCSGEDESQATAESAGKGQGTNKAKVMSWINQPELLT